MLEDGDAASTRKAERTAKQKHQKIALSYPELAYRAWGKRGQLLVQIGITLMHSGVCLTYHIRPTEFTNVGVASMQCRYIPTTVWLLLMIIQIPLSCILETFDD